MFIDTTHPAHKSSGFTLLELLVVLAIAAVLATLAAPSLVQFVTRSAMQSVSNDFIGSLQRARTEAVNLNMCVTICKSNSTSNAAPRCTPGAAGDYAADDWHMGWIIYRNPSCDRNVTTADPANAGNIVIVRQPGDSRYTLVVESGGPKSMTFGSQGYPGLAAAARFSLKDSQNSNSQFNRSICLDSLGRTRILADGAAC
jgi:type IV fimbrial biogenesis protein FimT